MRLRFPPSIIRSIRITPQSLAADARSFADLTSHTSSAILRRPIATSHTRRGIISSLSSFTRLGAQQYEGDFRGSLPSRPPDERTLRLGKTLRILQARLPTLLASPLPQEILAPDITLHLFPSTHPHLPTVSGRVAYHAALWTSPITWGRVPLVGNVNLEIQSERMVRTKRQQSSQLHEQSLQASGEKLIVRWRTCGKTKGLGTGANFRGVGAKQTVDRITVWLGGTEKRDDEEFCGLFIFEFDDAGRIASHVIERAEGSDGLDVEPSRWIGLTDWLLGRFGRGIEKRPELALGYSELGKKSAHCSGATLRQT